MTDELISDFEALHGSPLDKWNELKERVQQHDVKRFSEVATDFLAVLWCLDQYRINGLPPRGLGRLGDSPAQQLEGAYRMKGGWFADLVSLLLVNQTNSPLAPTSRVQGFSQVHQVDIAWPARQKAPLVCVETKVMGGPAYGRLPARSATADWSNRRKELKFQATDLKLYRRQQATHINHWDNWRKTAPPFVYFFWCARMKPGTDKLDKMVREVRALTETYLDGAGIFAYQPNKSDDGYTVTSLGQQDRVVDLDDLVHRIANQINDLTPSDFEGAPDETAVDVTALEPDEADPEE